MRRPFVLGVALAGLCLAWVGQAGALPTPISSSINLSLSVQASSSSGPATDSDSDSQGGTTNPLAATVSAMDVSGTASATAHASGAATWVNPAQGQVLFDRGFEIVNLSDGGVFFGAILQPDWTYTFVADATGTFSLDWSILGTGIPDTFGLGGFDFSFTGVANQFLDFNTSGSLIRPVVSGDTYTAGLNGLHGLGGNLGTRSANENAIFDFSMTTTPTTAVPEPTSFVLLGVGLLAAVLVRRRAV